MTLHPSAHHQGREFNFLLEQRNWLGYETLADAEEGIRFKQPGVPVYVIGEDTWYYWKNDVEGFVLFQTGSGPGGSLDTILFSSSRNSNIVRDQYLRTEDGIPMNQAPLYLPETFILKSISVTTLNNSTATFELRNKEVLIPGAVISLNNQNRNYALYNIPLNVESELMVYIDGQASKPKVNVLLQRVAGEAEIKPDILINGSRNSNIVRDQYLRTEDGIPMNQTPVLIPENFIIYALSVVCSDNSTCDFEIHNNEVLIPGGVISLSNEKEKYINLSLGITAGSKLMIFNKGTSSNPRVSIFLRKA